MDIWSAVELCYEWVRQLRSGLSSLRSASGERSHRRFPAAPAWHLSLPAMPAGPCARVKFDRGDLRDGNPVTKKFFQI